MLMEEKVFSERRTLRMGGIAFFPVKPEMRPSPGWLLDGSLVRPSVEAVKLYLDARPRETVR